MPAGLSAVYGGEQGSGSLLELSQGFRGHGESASGCHVLGHSCPRDNESGGNSADRGHYTRARSPWTAVKFDGVFNYSRM